MSRGKLWYKPNEEATRRGKTEKNAGGVAQDGSLGEEVKQIGSRGDDTEIS